MKKILLLLSGAFLVTAAFSQVVDPAYTLTPLTDDSVTVTSVSDHRNQIKWFSSDKAVVYNGEYYFTATTTNLGKELWKTDGTPEGTVLVMDINPGSESSSPDAFMVAGADGNEKLYFAADDGTHGKELWVTDGTTTELVLDLFQSANGQAEDIITPPDTMCLECVVEGIDTIYVWDSAKVAEGATGPTLCCEFDTIFSTVDGSDSIYLSTDYVIDSIDISCGEIVQVEYKNGLRIQQVEPVTYEVVNADYNPRNNRFYQSGYCYIRDADTVKQTGNGGSLPFALSTFGDDLIFTGIYEDQFISSQGLRWFFKYDIVNDVILLISDEIQPYPFLRQNDAMRWNIVEPFQTIDVEGEPIAIFMGKHYKYHDEVCYTNGEPKYDPNTGQLNPNAKTGIIADLTDTPDENSSIEGATTGCATLDWIQKVHPNWVLFRNSTLGKWGGSGLLGLDQNPWITNGYQTWLIDDMNQGLTGGDTRTSPSFLGDYFLFKGSLYSGGQAGPINKQITKFSSITPQSQETWFISGPDDNGAYGNSRLGKQGYFKNPHDGKEYMFFSARVDRGRTTGAGDPATHSKFDFAVEYALFATEGTYADLFIADSLSRTNTGNGDQTHQLTQMRDKLYMNDFTDGGERELFMFAFAGSGYAENTYKNVVDFSGTGNPSNVRSLDSILVIKAEVNSKLYALKENSPSYMGTTPEYDPADHYITVNPSDIPAWGDVVDYGFGTAVPLNDMVNTDLAPPGFVDIDEVVDIKAVDLYPNPANDYIRLTIDEKYTAVKYSIINMRGQIVQTGDYNGSEINVSGLATGQYSIGLLTEEKKVLVKVFLKN